MNYNYCWILDKRDFVKAEYSIIYIEEFIVKCSVTQGDPVSATLFSIVIDVILKHGTKRKYYHMTETTNCICGWHPANNKN